MKDHLGNTRLSFISEESEINISQTDFYYPFGIRIGSNIAGDEIKYLYNGKELFDDNGLYWYHGVYPVMFLIGGARFGIYPASFSGNPQIGQWHTMDPADEFNSPYLYVGNDPIIMVDPDGKQAYHHDADGNLTSTEYYYDHSIFSSRFWDLMFNEYDIVHYSNGVDQDWGGIISSTADYTGGNSIHQLGLNITVGFGVAGMHELGAIWDDKNFNIYYDVGFGFDASVGANYTKHIPFVGTGNIGINNIKGNAYNQVFAVGLVDFGFGGNTNSFRDVRPMSYNSSNIGLSFGLPAGFTGMWSNTMFLSKNNFKY